MTSNESSPMGGPGCHQPTFSGACGMLNLIKPTARCPLWKALVSGPKPWKFPPLPHPPDQILCSNSPDAGGAWRLREGRGITQVHTAQERDVILSFFKAVPWLSRDSPHVSTPSLPPLGSPDKLLCFLGARGLEVAGGMLS